MLSGGGGDRRLTRNPVGQALKIGNDVVGPHIELAEYRRGIRPHTGGSSEHGNADFAPGLFLVVTLVTLVAMVALIELLSF